MSEELPPPEANVEKPVQPPTQQEVINKEYADSVKAYSKKRLEIMAVEDNATRAAAYAELEASWKAQEIARKAKLPEGIKNAKLEEQRKQANEALLNKQKSAFGEVINLFERLMGKEQPRQESVPNAPKAERVGGKDYYKDLGIKKDADEEEVKRAYRNLAREHHPDRNIGDDDAPKRFERVQEAYDILSDKEKRREYDGH